MSENKLNFNLLIPPEMANQVLAAGVKKVQMDTMSTMLLGILAGMFIGFGTDLYIILMTGSSVMPFGAARFLGGIVFSFGLILVVIAGAELFTGNNLIVTAVAAGKVSVRYLLRNWVIVYIGNFIGSVALAALVWLGGQGSMADGAVGKLAVAIAGSKCELTFVEALLRGILCNILVCLAVWMCFSARSTTDKIVAIIFPIAAFVACGFEHCVANMYFVPFGMFHAIGMDNVPENLTWANFLVNNLVPVTIGNIIGGGGFGLLFYIIYLRRTPRYKDEAK